METLNEEQAHGGAVSTYETPIEMAVRHLAEWEVLIADQLLHIEQLARNRHLTVEAEAVLASLRSLEVTLQENLARQQAAIARLGQANL